MRKRCKKRDKDERDLIEWCVCGRERISWLFDESNKRSCESLSSLKISLEKRKKKFFSCLLTGYVQRVSQSTKKIFSFFSQECPFYTQPFPIHTLLIRVCLWETSCMFHPHSIKSLSSFHGISKIALTLLIIDWRNSDNY